jgi:hypothetical protein
MRGVEPTKRQALLYFPAECDSVMTPQSDII